MVVRSKASEVERVEAIEISTEPVFFPQSQLHSVNMFCAVVVADN